MAFEQTRDFRSDAQDAKRAKSHSTKWALGARPSAGVVIGWDGKFRTGSESQQTKSRPDKMPRHPQHFSHNITKPKVGYDMPLSQAWHKADALVELQDPNNTSTSIHELMPNGKSQGHPSGADNVLYSFDRSETPGKPLSLDVFIKTSTRDTEKLVEKEYEILDENGDALKGKKARKNLRRKSPQQPAAEPSVVEDDGFELL